MAVTLLTFSATCSHDRQVPAKGRDAAPAGGSRSPSDVKIRVDGLTRMTATGASLLDSVSLRIMAGELHGLIGPSGSGKTTVLRALNRLWEPPAGTVFFQGCDVTKVDVISLRRRVGMLFQSACLFDGTVGDNVRYGPALIGLKLRNEEVEDLLLQAGILDPASSFVNKDVTELSGGEAQRVALARTLANKPEVLLLDEPTSSLDQASTTLVENTILHLQREQGLTVVLVSHSMEQVTRLVTRATLLNKGLSLATGTLPELQSSNNVLLQQFFAGQSLATRQN